MTPDQVLEFVRDQGVTQIDCCFQEFSGPWQRCSFSAGQLTADSFTQGFGFDGSVIRGWQQINESDLLLVPVASTAYPDPFYNSPTLQLICDIKDPVTKKTYSRDPRSIARKAAAYLESTGIADTAMFAPEVEFFVFDRARYDQSINHAAYEVDSVEGRWNRGGDTPVNFGRQIRGHEGYFPGSPTDTLADLRASMVAAMEKMGVPVAGHHHEVATGGQCEIDPQHQALVPAADAMMRLKYVVKNIATRHGKTATFMPKPLHGDNGSGLHTHFSLWKDGRSIFAGRKYASLSQEALWAIGGILAHTDALLAFTNPTTNSFKRLVSGFEAPINLIYSSRNRSAAVRIPVYSHAEDSRRLELRFPDPSCNPYLAFSAILLAAIDGIEQKIDPGEPIDQGLDQLDSNQRSAIAQTPADLNGALDALSNDHAFLLEGGVFTPEMIHYWAQYKYQTEIMALAQRPHPYEFCMYYDV